MRLIDRDALWEKLTGKSKYYDEPPEEWSEIWDVIEGMPLVHPESKWIPCTERLPESFQEVLVCGDNGNMDIIVGFTVEGIDDRWIWQMSPKLLFVKKIVAWQPLPERYREEGEE